MLACQGPRWCVPDGFFLASLAHWAMDALRALAGCAWTSAGFKPAGLCCGPFLEAASGVLANKKAVDQKSTACHVFALSDGISLVPRRGLEPPRCYSLVPETSASTNSAIWASQEVSNYKGLEQLIGLRAEKDLKFFGMQFVCVSAVTMKKAEGLWPSALSGVVCLRWCPEEDSNLHDVTR